ncbi:hypothetical protein, partial [Acinetobacter baumannii]
MKNILFILLMLIFSILSIMLIGGYLYFSIFFLIFNLFICFFVVNNNSLSKNIITPQTILL